ncbi:penicillin-binding protein activator [Sphingomonas sp. BIUV-7]|uniref:Penicillin-binding protein activator n=1 Tax=Sphingomonas natans TaxID=3063330 RepID=A0ABT8YBN6_9SPHN|nr:penicillin-binding protein activator [Sphingomonas sp. BIUV-7]MDO6415742.1 penicillin-binding protein activator [Sphingomonas sp. BIUV-7]
MADPGQPGQIGARKILLTIVALLVAMWLSACAGGPRTSAPAPIKAPPTATAPKPQQGLPEDTDRHRVALLVPITGPNAGVGQSIANAAVLALADTKDRSLRVTTYDTGPGAAVAATKALAEGNALILGPLLGDDVRAVAGLAAARGVPVVSFSNDTSASADNVWLLGFQPAQSIERVVRFARSKGLTRFAGLVPQGAYGRTASGTLIRVAESAGGSVVAMQTYDRSPAAITAAVTALSKQKFDAVLIADSGRVTVVAVPLLRKKAVTAQVLGTELWNAEPGLSSVASLNGAWFASVDDAMFGQLSTRYRARYGKTPYRLASLGYDAVLLAVRIARDWKADAPFPSDRLGDAGGFAGVDGAFRFNRSRIAERSLAVHQLGAGGRSVVSPPPTGF